MNGSTALTEPHSRLLGSIRPRSPSRRTASILSKTYKQASTLYLTRRLPEALQLLETVTTVSRPANEEKEEEKREGEGDGEEQSSTAAPPIAGASRSTRVKLWNLYLAILNAIIDLGPEDGKKQFGSSKWRSVVAKARDGSIWQEVVQTGYGGVEGNVDADVVSNLATLLLAHSPSQTHNQTQLESYLSASSHPNLDITDRLSTLHQSNGDHQPQTARENGTNTPRDLSSRIKILELYTLHVLPRNEEWQYAREFIGMSEVLDEERREAFLDTLQSLEAQAKADHDHEARILRERDVELERERREADERRMEASGLEDEERSSKSQPPNGHERSNSEIDYGIENPNPGRSTKQASNGPKNTGSSLPDGAKPSPATSRAPARPKKPLPRTVYQRGAATVAAVRQLLSNVAQSMSKNPAALLRSLLFLLALILALARRDVRDRLGRTTGLSWDRIKATVGMGVKVSYI